MTFISIPAWEGSYTKQKVKTENYALWVITPRTLYTRV